MFRLLVYAVLLILLVRALRRLWGGLMIGMGGVPQGRGSSVPQRGVHMVRDPVCGTFIVPNRALTLSVGDEPIYFCSATCRDTYRARPSAHSPEPAEGRTA